ncbi:alpha/beta fold hydrolase [Streptomyces sp. NPDC058240]|uniref:alpha/beta fold hydrolase n=1 Tax=Streptomyces sp. NPDC058240 TaxID=3346396 RepID=UPI0036E7F06B
MATVQVSRVDVAYERVGHGPPLVFVQDTGPGRCLRRLEGGSLPGLFAGDPPAEFVPLLTAMADDVRPDARLVVLPGAGHVSNLEKPEHFNQAVREFCRAHA